VATYVCDSLIDHEAAARFAMAAEPNMPAAVAQALDLCERAAALDDAAALTDVLGDLAGCLADVRADSADALSGRLSAVLGAARQGGVSAELAVLLADCQRDLVALTGQA
jgi:hypothetical protein